MVIRCTGKLLKLLGVRGPAEVSPSRDDWYANLLWVDRRKCLLVVHAETLFPVFIPDIRKTDLSDLGSFLVPVIVDAVEYEELDRHVFGALDGTNARIAKTASRSTLGYMNEMIFTAELVVDEAGGLGSLDVKTLESQLRDTLFNRGGRYVTPGESARTRGEQ